MNAIKDQFLLKKDITFLNHGSFGACPKPIFEDYQKWQLALEEEPIQFITKTGILALNESKKELAAFIHCHEDDFVYVQNPTMAMNIVIKNLPLKANDEILTTNQEYGAVERTWHYYTEKVGAKLVKATIPLPLNTKEQFLNAFWAGLTPQTKYIFLSHITSPTALIFPVEEIIIKAKSLGIIVIIDGAHSPGHIPLDLSTLGADIYTGACHKWMLTPKGNSFLYVSKPLQYLMEPLVISWGYQSDFPSHSTFLDYHQYNGTKDFAAYLTTPKAIEWLAENDWQARTAVSKQLLLHYYPLLAKCLQSEPICAVSSDFLGQMCSVPIQTKQPIALKERLYNQYKIEVPIVQTNFGTFIRVSFQAYNTEKEIEYLIDCLNEIFD